MISVELEKVQDVSLSGKLNKDGVWLTKISFDGEFNIVDSSRILSLVRQGKSLNVTFNSPQAEFDLHIDEFQVNNGVLKDGK